MKLAISNIAWPSEKEAEIAGLLLELGVGGVEIAPTKVWENPGNVTREQIEEYRRYWSDQGIEIVALQALLFGRPDLTLFESDAGRSRTLEYLRRLMRLGGKLGARVLVFGSPKNRKVSGLSPSQIEDVAVSFFKEAGEAATEEGVVLCIEPNPVEYECDFVTTSAQGLELVRKVDSAGFGLHLDAAAITLALEEPESSLLQCGEFIRHFHVSEPFLKPIGGGGVDHKKMASALRLIRYPHCVSVEMRQNTEVPAMTEIRRVLELLVEIYGD